MFDVVLVHDFAKVGSMSIRDFDAHRGKRNLVALDDELLVFQSIILQLLEGDHWKAAAQCLKQS